jgi:hypothetical protein
MFWAYLRGRLRVPASSNQFGRRQLLGLGAVALAVGWGLTEAIVSFRPSLPVSLAAAAVGLWVGLFALVTVVALTQCPDYVRFSGPLLLWGVLNILAFLVTGAAVLGYLPVGLVVYTYWHVWVLVSVVGFAGTGVLLERSGPSGQHYFTAAGLEVSLLFIGLGAFTELVPGLYLLLAFVHPTPLALDAYPGDLGAGPDAAVQLSLYAAGLGLVLVL